MKKVEQIENETHLEDLLSTPSPGAVEAMASVDGDLMLLGAGGKMGPTLARMAVRASEEAGVRRRVLAVSRFGDARVEAGLREHGVETIRCDLLDAGQLAALPEVPNIVYMTGMKFGSTGQEPLTWAMNAYLPGMICQRFPRSRIVAFSTGNVYGLSPVAHGGSREADPLRPVGEYALSCLGRERLFEHFSQTLSIHVVLLRLNYACEMRYGVLVDVARKVWAGEPVDLGMGHFNAIWQGDANTMTLQAFTLVQSPAAVLNLAGPETLSVRRVAEQFGELFGKPATFAGEEGAEALLSNGQEGHRLFGYPRVSVGEMVRWVAAWVRGGGRDLGKPTHFESREGDF